MSPHAAPPTASLTGGARTPFISRLIPDHGPLSGGVALAVVGYNFTEDITCIKFGDVVVPCRVCEQASLSSFLCFGPESKSHATRLAVFHVGFWCSLTHLSVFSRSHAGFLLKAGLQCSAHTHDCYYTGARIARCVRCCPPL